MAIPGEAPAAAGYDAGVVMPLEVTGVGEGGSPQQLPRPVGGAGSHGDLGRGEVGGGR